MFVVVEKCGVITSLYHMKQHVAYVWLFVYIVHMYVCMYVAMNCCYGKGSNFLGSIYILNLMRYWKWNVQQRQTLKASEPEI